MRTHRYVLSTLALFLGFLGTIQAQTALQLEPVTPCRLVDTRQQTGGHGFQGTMSFNLPQLAQSGGAYGDCDLPGLSPAKAYSLNVTLVTVNHGHVGYLTIWPTGQPQPLVSLMNSDGRNKANAAITLAGSEGAVSVYLSDIADVLIDIDGYFDSPATDPAALAFYPVTPCRIVDTRSGLGGNYLHARQSMNFAIGGRCSLPGNAAAFSLNVTALPRTGTLNYLTVWPTGQTMPTTSTLNAPTGATTANAAVVQDGAQGQVSVFAYNDSDLLIDTNGYFAPAGGAGQLSLYPLTPCRVLDTRSSGGPFNGQRTVQVVGSACSVPAAAVGYVVNATVLPQGHLGYLTLWGQGQQPVVSTLNASDGAVTSNLAIVPANTQSGSFLAYASGSTQLLIDISTFLAPPVMVTNPSLPAGIINQQYQAQLTASGGLPPYTWLITNGSLPPGLSLNQNTGAIAGTPTTLGPFSFTVQATDSQNNTGSAQLTITIGTGTLVITTLQLPAGTQTLPYQATLGAAGGMPPYTWSITSGNLPSGLNLDGNTGVISGTPQMGGPSNFTVQVTDSAQNTATAPLQIAIDAQLTNGAFSGYYAFSLSGFQNGKAFALAGSLSADGLGNIPTGVLDLNTGAGSPTLGTSLTGTYAIGGNGTGTMSINAGSLGTLNFHLTLSAQGGQLILDNADPNPRGSGLLFSANPLNFHLPPPGNYAFGSVGADVAQQRYASAGAMQFTNVGGVTGSQDYNDNGTTRNRTFTGQFLTVNALTGRGQATLNFSDGHTNHYAYYVVNNGQFLFIATDPVSGVDPLIAGSILVQQTSVFNNSNLQGATVLETTALAPNGGSPVADVVLGLANWDGAGNGTVSLDENRGGTMTQQSAQGTYSVATLGRVVLSGFGGTPPILYLVGSNQAFVLGEDASVAFGMLEPQSAGPFNNTSLFGTYLGGTINPAQVPIVDTTGYFLADGNGNLTGFANTSGPSGTGTQAYAATYQVDATGRTMVTGSPAGIVYVVSPSKAVLLPSGNNPALGIFQAGLMQ